MLKPQSKVARLQTELAAPFLGLRQKMALVVVEGQWPEDPIGPLRLTFKWNVPYPQLRWSCIAAIAQTPCNMQFEDTRALCILQSRQDLRVTLSFGHLALETGNEDQTRQGISRGYASCCSWPARQWTLA